MIFLLIGTVVGSVMALTGAGGAIIGVPLLVHLAHYSIHDASVLALPIVATAAAVSLIFTFRHISSRVVSIIVIPAAFSSYALSFLKPIIPSYLIVGAMILLAILGLIHLWIKMPEQESSNTKPSSFHITIIGLIAGSITCLTGLGGGVVLFPLFRLFLKMKEQSALSTGLAVICLSTVFSLFFQRDQLLGLSIKIFEYLGLVVGFLVANTIMFFILKNVSTHTKNSLIRSGYSFVLCLSIVLLIF